MFVSDGVCEAGDHILKVYSTGVLGAVDDAEDTIDGEDEYEGEAGDEAEEGMGNVEGTA